MNKFTKTAIVDKCYRLLTKAANFRFPFFICSKCTEVAIFRQFHFPFSVSGILETWRQGDMEIETWRQGDMEIETWRNGDGDMET